MNSVEKDNIIQKAICCSGTKGKQVADMYLSGNKCADKEFQKLFLLTSYIDTLDCYQAPVDTTTYSVETGDSVLTEWTLIIPCTTWDTVLDPGDSGELTVNGASQNILGDGIITFGETIENLLSDLGFTYIVSACISTNITINITAACDTESIVAEIIGFFPGATVFTATKDTEGNCTGSIVVTTTNTTTYTNCLTEDQADSIANQIAKICDLCDEH